MLQRAASNAYSWWWASHIRTKQSKWLEENLQDMEEKVGNMLKIIENGGDSFSQRVEMYYNKRPELIRHVEDSYRSYRALAERYDHLSKELQSANRTIATVFPDQVHFSMYDNDEEDRGTSSTADDLYPVCKDAKVSSPIAPPTMPLVAAPSPAASADPSCLVMSREEAQAEIDGLQKEILALQTEREFVQSILERCRENCCGIEHRITELEGRVSSLQDEFEIVNHIDDHEARALMAATALKSCNETLVRLQNEQEKSAEEADVEVQRINEAELQFQVLKAEFMPEEMDMQENKNKRELGSPACNENNNEEILFPEKMAQKEVDADPGCSLTIMEVAEKINELVEKVVMLQTAVSSQGASVNLLRSETDTIQENIRILEESKESLLGSTESMKNKLKELEEEFHRIKGIEHCVKELSADLQTRLAEAHCNINYLLLKFQNMKPEENAENSGLGPETGAENQEESEEPVAAAAAAEKSSRGTCSGAEEEEPALNTEDGDAMVRIMHGLIREEVEEEKMKTVIERDGNSDCEADRTDQLHERVEDKEKLLLEEYAWVLQNYKEVKKKLGDVEKKNRDGFFELALQIRELKNALAQRDEEIEHLRKMSSLHKNLEESCEHSERYPASTPPATASAACLPSHCSPRQQQQQQVFCMARKHLSESAETTAGKSGKSVGPMSCYSASAREEKIRSDIDGLLEENLEFWLRFSTSFHQIPKFQTSVQDLKGELSKLKPNKRADASGKIQPSASEARAIYKHMRDIQTELTLWLENNSALKDELQGRHSMLGNIQDELARASIAGGGPQGELNEFQAAQFQGEVLNMKQESNKVSSEMEIGLESMRQLKVEVDSILKKLDQELGLLSESKQAGPAMYKAKVPLRSFLFGVKLKKAKPQKPSIFSCMSPLLQKQYSDMAMAQQLP